MKNYKEQKIAHSLIHTNVSGCSVPQDVPAEAFAEGAHQADDRGLRGHQGQEVRGHHGEGDSLIKQNKYLKT